VITSPKPIMNAGDTLPLMRSRRELENTTNAMQPGSIQMKVAIA